jgi:hypothetical protein
MYQHQHSAARNRVTVDAWQRLQCNIHGVDDVREKIKFIHTACKLDMVSGTRLDAKTWIGPIESTLRFMMRHDSKDTVDIVYYRIVAIIPFIMDSHGADDRSLAVKSCINTVRKVIVFATSKEKDKKRIAWLMASSLRIVITCSKYNKTTTFTGVEYVKVHLLDAMIPHTYDMVSRQGMPCDESKFTQAMEDLFFRVIVDMNKIQAYATIARANSRPRREIKSFVKATVCTALEDVRVRIKVVPKTSVTVGCFNADCKNVSCDRDHDMTLYTCTKCNVNKYCSRPCMFMDVNHSVTCVGQRDYSKDLVDRGYC